METSLKVAILILFCSFAYGMQRNAMRLIASAFMGDMLSTIPARLQCVGTGRNFTNFMYFSRVHPDRHKPLVPGDRKLLRESDFDPALPTKIIIHGFVDSIHLSDWMQKMKTKFLTTGEFNVIIVDWGCGNDFPYAQAIQNSKITAKELTNLVKFIMDETGAESSNFHLIGHSLGSHIAGRVGHAVPHLGRISAMDPPGPRFYEAVLEDRLDPGDAQFVDAIHTDAGHSFFEGMGILSNVGHVDFYPNGGKDQPGCHGSPFSILPRIGFQRAVRYYVTCDHFRSIEYYMDSIRPPVQLKLSGEPECQPIGVACRDWETYEQGRCADCSHDGDCAHMGYFSDQFHNSEVAKHKYFVKTADDEPFCVFQYQVIVETGCKDGICNEEISKSGLNPGVISLELNSNSGKMNRLDLLDKEEKELKPGSQYVYLATSRFPLGIIQRGRVWWGSRQKPNTPAVFSAPPAGLNLKKIEIVPIELPEKLQSLSTPQMTVLCGSPEKTVTRNQYLELTVNDC